MTPTLYSNYMKFRRIVKRNLDNNIIDLSNIDFIPVPTLLPLIQYMDLNSKMWDTPNSDVNNFIEKVYGVQKHTDTTMPLFRLNRYPVNEYGILSEEIESYLDNVTDDILKFLPNNVDLDSIFYLLYELILNIYIHSRFKNAYILGQKYPKINTIDICLIDDGITIPGDFEKSNFDFNSDGEAIFDAINGKSTDKGKVGLHGRGLNTSARLTSLGFGEEMFIVSRNGMCRINSKGAKIKDIQEPYIKGTFIAVRVNTNKINNLSNYYKKVKPIRRL